MKTSTRHIGRNVSRLRELRGMKQEALAQAMGVSQQAVSHLENSEEIEESKLKEIGKILGVSVETLKNFSDEGVITYFNTIYNDQNSPIHINSQCTINPLEKMIEFQQTIQDLYERLLQAEKDKVAYLEALLSKTH